jgi:hypothetical protein
MFQDIPCTLLEERIDLQPVSLRGPGTYGCCRDSLVGTLVTVLVKFIEEGAEKQLVVCSAYLPYNPEDPPPPAKGVGGTCAIL